uniref:Uncharacterized protein n=1 Tax=Siphoviridae sp. ctuOq1 TaxID=2825713 RepID=A0A8S5UZ39_9CAUD|nr:MAG TPA: hypothetical protein [Siphoviridae sp. ctuOq1]
MSHSSPVILCSFKSLTYKSVSDSLEATNIATIISFFSIVIMFFKCIVMKSNFKFLLLISYLTTIIYLLVQILNVIQK